jgi:hypothetical protein
MFAKLWANEHKYHDVDEVQSAATLQQVRP